MPSKSEKPETSGTSSPSQKKPLDSLIKVSQTSASLTKEEALAALKQVNSMARSLSRVGAGPQRAAPNFVSELNNIDFQKMIGGPLQAAVNAQVASSLASVDFINSIGFTETTGGAKELVMVDFTHQKSDVDEAGNTVNTTRNIRVPLISMVQIPSLRIEYVEINFNVKLNSVETQSTSSSLALNASASGGWGPVKFKVSGSYQRSTATGIKVEREYLLNVKVRAVQDEMPAGLERILGMLAA